MRGRRTRAGLLLLTPLLLVAAGWWEPKGDPAGPSVSGISPDPAHHDSIAPGYWLAILDAPVTPAGYQPGPGPRFAYPVRGPQTQPFGCTNFGLEPQTSSCRGGFHSGVDLAPAEGTPIRAAGDGTAYPLPDYEYYGNHVLIQHIGGLATVYGHMSRMNVDWGQPVRRGDLIGWVGSTGNSTGPHLHFEVRVGGVPVDPIPYLEGSPPAPPPLPAGWPGMPPDDTLGFR